MQKFNVTEMSWETCSAIVENAVSKIPGVDSCVVNLHAATMTVDGSATKDEIIDAVVKAGYGASVQSEENAFAEKN
ncbi:MAG: cation transporter [Spirochaetales bacterium]|nr:cation transporter [Spirochaetales bacterium]